MGVGERHGSDLGDDSAGQYYGRLDSQNGEQQLWMEETRSLGLKMDLIKKYDLGRRSRMAAGAGNQRRLGCDWLGVETI
ncbi:MAG: hypothetical protein ACLR8P_05965 [Clostridium fessum]